MRSMITLIVLSCVAASPLWMGSATAHPTRWETSQCLDEDTASIVIEGYVDSLATASQHQAFRDSIGLARTSSDSVSLISDSILCARAAAALDSLLSEPQPTGRDVYAFEVGSAFAVHDPAELAGAQNEWIAFFDSAWVFLGSIVPGGP